MDDKLKINQKLFYTTSERSAVFIRIVIGLIFFTEGLQKYIFPELLGTGRFAKIGFMDPSFWAYFTGTFEIICGVLVIIGFAIRISAMPLLIIIITAFITTKWPLLIQKGFWVMIHEYRTDFAMTVLLIYLIIFGAGKWSVDAYFSSMANHKKNVPNP